VGGAYRPLRKPIYNLLLGICWTLVSSNASSCAPVGHQQCTRTVGSCHNARSISIFFFSALSRLQTAHFLSPVIVVLGVCKIWDEKQQIAILRLTVRCIFPTKEIMGARNFSKIWTSSNLQRLYFQTKIFVKKNIYSQSHGDNLKNVMSIIATKVASHFCYKWVSNDVTWRQLNDYRALRQFDRIPLAEYFWRLRVKSNIG